MTETFNIPAFLSTLPFMPGVYRMLDARGNVLYVGKAKSLKNRVSSYFNRDRKGVKTEALVKKIHSIEITITETETEALLLEHNLIKALKPPYNILLRDDKSYPYILVSEDHTYPRISFHRGKSKKKGTRYFGPYPSVGSVRKTLNWLKKSFKVRQCEDSFFNNRARPCLEYQIGRCTAPCVGLIDPEHYREDVNHSMAVLLGRQDVLSEALTNRMSKASEALDFEQAAIYRDQLQTVREMQSQQNVMHERGEIDVFCWITDCGVTCIQSLIIRQGQVIGGKSYFPEILDFNEASALEQFLAQYYLRENVVSGLPAEIVLDVPEIITNEDFDSAILVDAIKQLHQRTVRITRQVRGQRLAWIDLTRKNAEQSLQARMASQQNHQQRHQALEKWFQNVLQDPSIPLDAIECFDISHTQGDSTVASCVVFDKNGANYASYRRLNIKTTDQGDDYQAIYEAVRRRYKRLTTEASEHSIELDSEKYTLRKPTKPTAPLPELVFIDGGKGQLGKAMEVFVELNWWPKLALGIAKGRSRKAGMETFFRIDFVNDLITQQLVPKIVLLDNCPTGLALHYIHFIRDESHRFAITGHRKQRSKRSQSSALEDLPGIGASRRRALIHHFGGWQGIRAASPRDLARVPGISLKLAQSIYDALQGVETSVVDTDEE
ncbi:MAG: excinuclease ABC subunit UvrC [Pseudomonadota bacterium]